MVSEEHVVRIDGRRLRVTNLSKVVYPETGTTKGEVIDYYARVAPAILPALAGRPVTRKRWVDGVGSAADPAGSFFAKQLEQGAPEWIRRLPISHTGGAKDYPLIDDVPSLAWLAQVASLELHVPQWRFSPDGERQNPDRLVLDLDPGPSADLAQCAEIARIVRVLLEGMGLPPVPVTSGSKGIHLYAALPGAQTSEEVSAVARELARAVEADHPDLATSTMSKALRTGKVFIDWSQNNGKKTTVSPYSLRGRPQPWVAVPRTWEELEDPALRQLSFEEVLDRIETGIDPFAALSGRTGPDGTADNALAAYLAKRDASKTPEPMPEMPPVAVVAGATSRRFVIQEHRARRLHYDLRIEDAGVLVSWAVPKGVPDQVDHNHLAVMTEPHPLEYLGFAGTIPRGEYGAGEMTVWDTGTVALEKWRDDEVIGTFTGRPGGPLGTARLALIRTSGEGEKSSWLLHRMTERARPSSVPSPRARRAAASSSVIDRPVILRGDGEPPTPMLAENGTPGSVASLGGWAEIKWDGIRAIGTWTRDEDGRGRLLLRARSGTDVTDRYPELTADGAPHLTVDDAVVDGEIIALDETGRPSFAWLQNRMHLTRAREIEREAVRTPVRYHLFDLLRLDGHDLSPLPLRDRRELLERIIEGSDAAVAVPPVFEDVAAALETSTALGLEGVVVKDPTSRYLAGQRSARWLKVKHTRTQEAVVVGIRPGKGDRAGRIGSLLLAVPDTAAPSGLRYVGRVGTGFTDRALDHLSSALDALRVDRCPVDGVPAADAADAHWVSPRLVGEVEFANWTPDRILRHARWRGLRPDKTPAEVMLES